jgi:hypothetical protein
MNKQEMRRLGILPYEEDEIIVENTWHSGVVRRRRRDVQQLNFTVERTEVVPRSRRINRETGRIEEVTERLAQEIAESVDRDILEQIETEAQLTEAFGQPQEENFAEWPPNEEVGLTPELEEDQNETLAQRAWRNFLARFR